MALKGHAAATFIHNFVTLPNHIFISCQQTTLTVSNFADFKAIFSSGFDEISLTSPFQKLATRKYCFLSGPHEHLLINKKTAWQKFSM